MKITEVKLPRFSLVTTLDLKEALIASGLTKIFNINDCDLSNLTNSGSKDLFVSSAKQKVMLEVNEEGSEAAAANIAVVILKCKRAKAPEIKKFHCTLPFFFAICDNVTGMVIFSGRVINPTTN